jgi:hypothetical protein
MPWHSILSKMRIMLQIDLFSLFPCFFYEMDYSHILLADLVLESSNHMAIRESSNSSYSELRNQLQLTSFKTCMFIGQLTRATKSQVASFLVKLTPSKNYLKVYDTNTFGRFQF